MQAEIIFFIVGLVAGAAVGWLARPAKSADLDRQQYEKFRSDSIALKSRLDDAVMRLDISEKENKSNISRLAAASEKISAFDEMRENMKGEFRKMSLELLEAQKKSAAEEQTKTLGATINPFKEQIEKLKDSFDKQIKELLKDGAENKTSFAENIKKMMESSGALQKEAADLSEALRGKKKLGGTWAELQIENIFNIAGLQKGRDYTAQEYHIDDEKRRVTDFVLNLPGQRRVVIDSKLSLASYERYISAESDDEKDKFIGEFVAATKDRIKELSGKEYQNLVGGSKLDYVFMFMPFEHAYIEALRHDKSLYDFAFSKNVAITTPSLLLPMMRLVNNLWNIEKQNKTAQKVQQLVQSIYEKYVGFTKSFAEVGSKLDGAQTEYKKALGQLSDGKGSMSSLFDRMKKDGGIQTSKSIAIEYHEDENDEQ